MNHFDSFWERYPKKVDKKQTKDKWKAKKLDDQWEKISEYLDYLERHDDKWKAGYILNPLTFVNKERWKDREHWRAPRGTPKGSTKVPDVNKVSDWLIANIGLSERQVTAPWTWIFNDDKGIFTGVVILDQRIMFQDLVGDGVRSHGDGRHKNSNGSTPITRAASEKVVELRPGSGGRENAGSRQ